jgi:lactam utilization protein B
MNMGLEKIVLDKLESINAVIADCAYFCNGTLFVRGDDGYQARDIDRVVEQLKQMLYCNIEATFSGNEFAIDFK